MDNSAKRLGIAMLIVVVVLGFNGFAVLSGAADRSYGRLFAYQTERFRVATRARATEKAPVVSAVECAPSQARRVQFLAPVPVAGVSIDAVPVSRAC